jgi:hypothetical protein
MSSPSHVGNYANRWRHLCLASIYVSAAIGIAGCGGTTQQNGTPQGEPTIVGAKIVHSHVQVRYRVPGANGGFWPVMRLSLLEPETGLPPSSQDYRPLDEEEGTVTLPFDLERNRELVVYGSVVYENGIRIHLPERHLRVRASS